MDMALGTYSASLWFHMEDVKTQMKFYMVVAVPTV